MEALNMQQKWRTKERSPGDRLGEVLVRQGILTEEVLEEPLLEHMRDEKPLGRILIDRGICSPEQIIEALIERDHKRQYEFLEYVKGSQAGEGPSGTETADQAEKSGDSKKSSLVDKLSTWFSRPKGKQ